VAKKSSKVDQFQKELAKLSETIVDDLHLPSLKENRLEGFAASFVIVLPLMNNQGQPVFTGAHLDALFRIVDNRFGDAWCRLPVPIRPIGAFGILRADTSRKPNWTM
jgi:hypothetical protein